MMKNKRIPTEIIYDNFYTLVIALSVCWILYYFSPTNHCSVYFIDEKNTKKQSIFY